MDRFIAVAGPTASGKTALSLALAEKYNGEILSADAFQIYRKLDIGTAKITQNEMLDIPHYMIDEYDADAEVSICTFTEKARIYIETIDRKNKMPILVGGSGLYLDSIVYDSYDYNSDTIDPIYRAELVELDNIKGSDYLFSLLESADPEYAAITHPNNSNRVIRALEYIHASGQKKSDITKKKKYRYPNTLYFAINLDRNILYERINNRVDDMIRRGLLSEVRQLLDLGYDQSNRSMQAIGYKELIPVLQGTIKLQDAIAQIKQNSRNYAKRQMTWFRRNHDIIWIDAMKYQTTKEMLSYAEGFINGNLS